MSGHHDPSHLRLTPYQQELVERLEPVLARMDPTRVTPESGLKIEKSRKWLVVRVSVQARDQRIPGLGLFASPAQCILGFAESEIVECHSDPAARRGLVDEVVDLTERYLGGVTLVQHKDKRGRVIRAQYWFGVQAERDSTTPFGTSRTLFSFRRVEQTETLSYRFLKEAGAV